jgi:hypothetical protein
MAFCSTSTVKVSRASASLLWGPSILWRRCAPLDSKIESAVLGYDAKSLRKVDMGLTRREMKLQEKKKEGKRSLEVR